MIDSETYKYMLLSLLIVKRPQKLPSKTDDYSNKLKYIYLSPYCINYVSIHQRITQRIIDMY